MVRVSGGSLARMAARLRSSASRSTSTQAGRRAASRSPTPGAASATPRSSVSETETPSASSEGRGSAVEAMPVQVAEGGGLPQDDDLDRAGLAVAVLGDAELGQTLVLLRLAVDLVP